MPAHFITGLDVGTSSIKAVVAERSGSRLIPRFFFKEPSFGVRRGAIIDAGEISPAVARVLAEVKKFDRLAAANVYTSIGSTQVRVQTSRGIVAVSRADSEIYQDDIDRVIKASQAVQMGSNRSVIHSVTREFIVDGVSDIVDPLGLTGSRLEVNTLVIDVFAPHVRAISRVIEATGGEVSGMVFAPLAAARAVLSKNQKNLGSVLISIGAGTTGVAVYEENKLWSVAQFPVGSSHISHDLAIGLKIPVDLAEIIKIEHGYAVAKEIHAKDFIDLSQYSGMSQSAGTVSRRLVAEIIQSRLDEIFEFVFQELKNCGKAGHLAAGAVLVGGGSRMPGICDLGRTQLKSTCQLGSAMLDEWSLENEQFSTAFSDCDYAVALGLVLSAFDQEVGAQGQSRFSGGVSKVREWFRYFLP